MPRKGYKQSAQHIRKLVEARRNRTIARDSSFDIDPNFNKDIDEGYAVTVKAMGGSRSEVNRIRRNINQEAVSGKSLSSRLRSAALKRSNTPQPVPFSDKEIAEHRLERRRPAPSPVPLPSEKKPKSTRQRSAPQPVPIEPRPDPVRDEYKREADEAFRRAMSSLKKRKK